jgi:hypothetical protein
MRRMDLGTFAPLFYAHAHNRRNVYFDTVFFWIFLAIFQLKNIYQQHNSTKLDV